MTIEKLDLNILAQNALFHIVNFVFTSTQSIQNLEYVSYMYLHVCIEWLTEAQQHDYDSYGSVRELEMIKLDGHYPRDEAHQAHDQPRHLQKTITLLTQF
mgnify:CR=1 FL=1